MTRLYVSGGMSGYVDHNFPAFNEAGRELQCGSCSQHEEVDRLRARLAEAEVEVARLTRIHREDRGHWKAARDAQQEGWDAAEAVIADLRARLAEVEAEREFEKDRVQRWARRCAEAEARLAEVEAALLQGGQTAQIRCNAALLALDGWTTKPPSAAAEGDDRG